MVQLGDLGCDQVEVAVQQNIVEEVASGVYKTKIALNDLDLPVLDTSPVTPDGYDGPLIAPTVVMKAGHPFVLESDAVSEQRRND